LGEWSRDEQKEMPFLINDSIDIIKSFGTIGVARTMNFHNKR
jgi:PTH1 family peptidyl-tRNA hydrolase